VADSEVLVSRDAGILVITLNRPEARNAVNNALARQVATALDELDGDPELKIGIIAGAGGTFCAGMDLKAFVRGEHAYVKGRGFGGIVERPPAKPLIAAVEGYALAGGCEIALACDVIVASRTAAFGLPEVRRGLVASGGGLLRLPRRIPYHVAMEYSLTGAHLSATRGYELGLVNHLVDEGGALAAAKELGARIAANGPLAVRVTKQILVSSPDWDSEDEFARQAEITKAINSSHDAVEGATAFAEKRPPVWTGR
jgi:enoyl-CoA hydratase